MKIKYEPVFGDQALFDNDQSEAIVVVSFDDGAKVFIDAERYKSQSPLFGYNGSFSIAMRRVISTPTWTVADQKAGKLPEVGSKAVQAHDFRVVDVLAVRNGCVVVCNSDVIDSRPCVFTIDNFLAIYKPIESPEEKAVRLKYEWAKNANELIFNHCSSTTLTEYLRVIHDAMISGDLPVPVKGE